MDLVGKRIKDEGWGNSFVDVEWASEDKDGFYYIAGKDEDLFPWAGSIKTRQIEIIEKLIDKPAPKKLPSQRIQEIYSSHLQVYHRSQSAQSFECDGCERARSDAVIQYLDEDFKERNK